MSIKLNLKIILLKNIISNTLVTSIIYIYKEHSGEVIILSKKTIIKGTFILTIAGIATKLLGFYNRIFLTRLIGVKELGIYQLIFPIYILAFSFCCQGISTALTKQVSHYMAKNKPLYARHVFKNALFISFFLSLAAFLTVYFFSDYISIYILKNSRCGELLKIISLAIPFVAIKGCINSFFMGLNMPGYQGISHFIEQVIRIGTAYILSLLWVSEKINAAMAVTAVISGEIFAAICAALFYLRYKRKNRIISKTMIHKRNSLVKIFIKDASLMTANNLLLTLFSCFEAIILPVMLFKHYASQDIAMELYGIVTGIVIPFLLLPATVTTSLSAMLLPAVSCAKAIKNPNKLARTILYSVSFCCFLGIITAIMYYMLGEWICTFAFKSPLAGTILKNMCFICPLIYMSGNMSAILNGLDKALLNLLFNIINISIRIGFILTLVPLYGIKAYILGMTVSYVFLNLSMLTACKE